MTIRVRLADTCRKARLQNLLPTVQPMPHYSHFTKIRSRGVVHRDVQVIIISHHRIKTNRFSLTAGHIMLKSSASRDKTAPFRQGSTAHHPSIVERLGQSPSRFALNRHFTQCPVIDRGTGTSL